MLLLLMCDGPGAGLRKTRCAWSGRWTRLCAACWSPAPAPCPETERTHPVRYLTAGLYISQDSIFHRTLYFTGIYISQDSIFHSENCSLSRSFPFQDVLIITHSPFCHFFNPFCMYFTNRCHLKKYLIHFTYL
jgi:hypothetical protein